MATLAVVNAIENYLAANWSELPIIGVLTPGDRPSDGSAFLVVQYPVASSDRMTIGAPGANVWRTEGAFRIVLHGKIEDGAQPVLEWADTLAALFRGKDISGVITDAPSPPVIDDSNDEALYFRASFAVPYTHDVIG